MDSEKISEEKLNWLREVGAREFELPMKYYIHNWIFSEEYLKNTPLEVLKERYKDVRPDGPERKVE